MDKEKIISEILQFHKERDDEFIRRFCNKGAYIDEHGGTIHGVCKSVTAEEMLTFLHQQDARQLQIIRRE